jgi:hypothetical protein
MGKGHKQTKEHKKKIGNAVKGKNNGLWKGDNVKYDGVHAWIRRHKLKPLLCEDCKKTPPKDLANISGEYKRDLNDYKWLCRRCHMIEDKRLNNFRTMPRTKGSLHGMAILNEDKVRKIKTLLLITDKLTPIAEKFDVSSAVISQIKRGINWKHVEINEKEVII